MATVSRAKMTERVRRLRELNLSAKPEICPERARLLTQSWEETKGLPYPIRRAKALEKILTEMTICIQPGELIVGNHASKPRSAPVFPEFDVSYLEQELDEFENRPGDAFIVPESVKDELRGIFNYWRDNTVRDLATNMLPEETKLAGECYVNVIDSDWVLQNGDGHIAPDFPRLVNQGLNQIIAEVKKHIAKLDYAEPDSIGKKIFYESVIITNEAVLAFAKRFAELARNMAVDEKDGQRKQELLDVAKRCAWVPKNPARTFIEGLQSIWFVQLAFQLETNGHSVSIGRFDQFMWPLYSREVATGQLTREQALEITQCFWLKLSEISKLKSWPCTQYFRGGALFQNLTIGGQTRDGADATNELSYIGLDATESMKLIQPPLTARIHRNTPDEFIAACAQVISTGGGMPALFNDDIIIPSMLNRGVAVEDARDYTMIGCVEPTVQGKWGGRFGACFFNMAKALELALNDGKDPRTGIQLHEGSGDLSTFESFDEIMEAYKDQVEFFARQQSIKDNVQDMAWEALIPTPLLSSLTSDCLARGKEIKKGGAIYDFTGGQTGAIANVANSLAAIKKLVFEDKVLTGAELKQAIDTNFEGLEGEKIRQMLISKVPKYGNDDDYVDQIAKEAFSIFLVQGPRYKNTRWGRGPIGCTWHPSTASVSANVPMGSVVGALPDGRKAGVPLADVESAWHGTDMKGPTAMVKSASKLDHIYMSGGSLLNLRIHPSAFE